MDQMLYSFPSQTQNQEKPNKQLLGNKGFGLAEMTLLGLPVPPGFILTTELYKHFLVDPSFLDKKKADFEKQIKQMEQRFSETARFGDPENPLLISVRSGAPVSMPGMMDTLLNLGLTNRTVEGLAKQTKDPWFAYDCYRRFIQIYGKVVLQMGGQGQENLFEHILKRYMKKREVQTEMDLTLEDLQSIVSLFQKEMEHLGKPFPQDPWVQFIGAVSAVFRSWNNERAKTYRAMFHISDELGTAAIIQSMVFGNRGNDSGTGVLFTRNPTTGEKELYGEFLQNAQGEDVVSGTRTPKPLLELKQVFPKAYQELEQMSRTLEAHFKEMQDIEFTMQQGKVWMLQTRNGKRGGKAMVKIAVDLVAEGVISKQEALLRLEPEKLSELFHFTLAQTENLEKHVLCKGLPASPGAASGPIVFTSNTAKLFAEQGKKAILVRMDTSPDDVAGMKVAAGILTSRGGMTSHAAVVARGMGVCAVVGAHELKIDEKKQELLVQGIVLKEGDFITLDGSSGEILSGNLPLVKTDVEHFVEYKTLMKWADESRQLKVRANADTQEDAKVARMLGAEGIGLCRTEHMFFAKDRMLFMQKMILADTFAERKEALLALAPLQRNDFALLFSEMQGYPVTIRLLDPPLHEFLPKTEQEEIQTAQSLKVSLSILQQRKQALQESNPMLGYRGCRLGILHPEIYQMQAEAILQAAHEVSLSGMSVDVEIMIPLVGHAKELSILRNQIEELMVAFVKPSSQISVRIGTMIELPRACLVADQIAEYADFFSFGTNDLTQTTLGLSRDDVGLFLPTYAEKNIYPIDPFVSIDREGVGSLMKIAIEKAKISKKSMKLGICGEHGGDPNSVQFCHTLGLDYVSCSPYRVPIARLAAAQAALKDI